MSAEITIIQVTADGEQVSVKYNMDKRDYERMLPYKTRQVVEGKVVEGIAPGETVRQILEPYFKLADERRYEINKRVQAANYYQRKLAKLSPEAFQMVNEIWEILHGRRPEQALDDVLEQDRLEREKAIAEMRANQQKTGQQPQPTEGTKEPDIAPVNADEPL